uniref:SFRICE_014257 n=1 Tax=Spodoptera frugiperda TaxID=7108 RepID=A0A2H1VPK4_SPOFR
MQGTPHRMLQRAVLAMMTPERLLPPNQRQKPAETPVSEMSGPGERKEQKPYRPPPYERPYGPPDNPKDRPRA